MEVDTLAEWTEIMDECTKGFSSMVLKQAVLGDNNTPQYKQLPVPGDSAQALQDIFYFVGKKDPEFKINPKGKWWGFHDKRFKSPGTASNTVDAPTAIVERVGPVRAPYNARTRADALSTAAAEMRRTLAIKRDKRHGLKSNGSKDGTANMRHRVSTGPKRVSESLSRDKGGHKEAATAPQARRTKRFGGL